MNQEEREAGAAGSDPSEGRRRHREQLARFFRDQRVEIAVAVLIVASVVVIVLEASLPRTDPLVPVLELINESFTSLFAIELLLRYLSVRQTRDFLLEYWVDLLAVLPLLRPLRFLRFLRLLRLFRAGLVLHRRGRKLSRSFADTFGEYFLLGMFLTTVVFLATVGVMQTEADSDPVFGSPQSAFWWSVFLLSTGEMTVVPLTTTGRLLAMFVVMSGMTVFAVFTGITSAVMVQRLRRRMDEKALSLEELRDHIVICGWNRSGSTLLRALHARDPEHPQPVVIVAEFAPNEEFDYDGLSPEHIHILRGDYTRVSVLEQAGIPLASAVVLLADKVVLRSDQDRDARTVLAALTIEKLSPRVFSAVELLNADNETHLRMAGVEEVLVKDTLQANMLAMACLHRGLGRTVRDLLACDRGNTFHTCELPEAWMGLALGRVFEAVKRQANAVVLGVESGGQVLVNPPLDRPFVPGDQLLVVAEELPDLERVSPDEP
jgi:voltage-gated potassium channel